MSIILSAYKKISSKWLIFFIEQVLITISLVLTLGTYNVLALKNISGREIILYMSVNLLMGITGSLVFYTHKDIIRYSEIKDISKVLLSVLGSFMIWTLIISVSGNSIFSNPLPLYMILIHSMTSATMLISFRVGVREVYLRFVKAKNIKTNILIYGAGDKGIATKKTMDLDRSNNSKAIAFLDDDQAKTGKSIGGLLVESTEKSNLLLLFKKHKIKEIIIAADHLVPENKLRLAKHCEEAGVVLKQTPPLRQWTAGTFNFKQLKKVNIEMLLERPIIKVLNESTHEELKDAIVLVTGAAGSIGSEICRQLSPYPIKRLIAIDQAETPLFDLTNEVNNTFPTLNLKSILCSIRDQDVINNIMQEYKPTVVFHAAGYKHVPMLEEFPSEVVKTNVMGTKIVVEAAANAGVRKFVMVSSDKAVNPTNLMGASKRIAEMIIQEISEHTSMQCITTRFGNVLGSNGSVVPTFRKQIEEGGPITVTHPDITRYFMTIPEASALVIEAASMGRSNEIFVFDMGEPVRIIDLAEKMIRLANMIPEKDIKIEFSGLRAGEKLYEELFSENEALIPTHHPKIMKAKNGLSIQINSLMLNALINEAGKCDNTKVRNLVHELVPELVKTYQTQAFASRN